MKMRSALTCSALALLGAVASGTLAPPAEAQAVVNGYYAQGPGYYYPPPPPPPAYYYPPPTYYYPPPPPPPVYYYPAPAYYQQPSYWEPGIGLNFVFGFGGGRHHRHHH